MTDPFRAARRRRWTSRPTIDPINADMNDVLRGAHRRGQVTPAPAIAPAPVPAPAPVDDAAATAETIARSLGFRNPALGVRLAAGITDPTAIRDELRQVAREAPSLVRPPADWGGGPRGAPPREVTSRDMSDAIREEARRRLDARDERRSRR